MDRRIQGIPASPGIVVGYVHLLRWEVPDVRHRIIPDEAVNEELTKLHDAIARAKARIARARAAITPSSAISETSRAAMRSADGNKVRSTGIGASMASPNLEAKRPASVRAARTVIC